MEFGRGDEIALARLREAEERRKRELEEEELRDKANKTLREAFRKKRLDLLSTLAKRLRSTKRYYNGKQDDKWDDILRAKDLHLLFFSMVGLTVSVIISYYKWDQRCYSKTLYPIGGTPYSSCAPEFATDKNATIGVATLQNTADNYRVVFFVLFTGQFLLTGSTLVCCILIYQLYELKTQERRREWSGISEIDLIEAGGTSADSLVLRENFLNSYKLLSSSMKWELLSEVFIHLLHPLAFLETSAGTQTFYEISECFIFLRMYLILRILYQSSHIYRLRFDIVNSNRELQRLGYRISASSTFKILFYQYTASVVIGLFILVIFIYGFWMFVIERNNNAQFALLFDAYWYVWVSMATIGYGDMTPFSTTGRVVAIMIAATSFFILTLFSGIVTNLLQPTREQKYVASYSAQKAADKDYREAAGKMLLQAFKEWKTTKSTRWSEIASGSMAKRSPAMYGTIKEFRAARLASRNALGAAADPVIDGKLQRTIMLAYRLNLQLDAQQEKIQSLEQLILNSTSKIKKSASEKRGTALSAEKVKEMAQERGVFDAML
jgi:hypothetical protein